MRGSGRIYRQKGCAKWTIQYYRNGKRIRESTGTDDYKEAAKKLAMQLAKIKAQTFVDPKIERVRVSELAEPFFRDQRINKRKGIKLATQRWTNHVEPFFGAMRVVNVGSDAIDQYVDQRLAAGAANATINREFSLLGRMFRLGYDAKKVPRIPRFRHLKENNVRKGFVDDAQFDRLVGQNPPLWLRSILEMAYEYGWRLSELVNLRVRNVDLANQSVALDAGTTKNDRARLVKMTKNVETLLRQCVADKAPDDPVFTCKGKRVRNFRKRWKKMCETAGLGRWVCPDCKIAIGPKGECSKCRRRFQQRELKWDGLLFHDLRRSAVRNLVRSGISEKVAMTITGHKTRSVFDRYDIVSERDLADAALKSQARREAARNEFGHKDGHNQSQTRAEGAPARGERVN